MVRWILFFMFFGVQLSFAAPTVSITEDDLPKLIREKNKNISGANTLTQAAQAKTGHLVRSFLPAVEGIVGGEHFQTGNYDSMTQPYGGLEAKINLFRGGKDSLEENIHEGQVHSSEANSEKIYTTELVEARQLYWKMAFNREMTSFLRNALEQNQKYLDMANKRISRGLSSETDRLDFQIHHSQVKEEIESLEHEITLLNISLCAILGADQGTQFVTQTSIPHSHDEALLKAEYASGSHPEVKLLKSNRDIYSFQKSQANRWWMPTLDLYGGYYLYTLRDRDYLNRDLRDDTVVGLRLTLQIFDGLQSKANAKSFALQESAFEQQSFQRKKTVEAQIEVAKEDLKHDHELIHYGEERIDQGKKYLSRTLDEYNRGVKNSIDVLSAAQRYVGFQKQYLERRRNYQITKSGLLSLMNK